MDRVYTRSGNKEGGAPEMVESNPTPTIPTTNLSPYALMTLKHKLSQPAPPQASSYWREASLPSNCFLWSRSEVKAVAAAATSSRRGGKSQERPQTEEEDAISKDPFPLTQEEEDAFWAKEALEHLPTPFADLEEEEDAFSKDPLSPPTHEVDAFRAKEAREHFLTSLADIEEEEEDAFWAKETREHFPTHLAGLSGKTAQLAIEYYKNKEGVQLQLTEMINARDHQLTDLGFITHLQFKASCGEPSDAPPKTVYAQIHRTGPWPPIFGKPHCNFKKAHASRVFTHESPLLKDPRFQVDPTNGWIDYPFDCPECGLDALEFEDVLERLQFEGPE